MKTIPLPLVDALAVVLVFVAGARTRDNDRGIHAHVLFDSLVSHAERGGYTRADELRAIMAGTDLVAARAEAARVIKAIGTTTVMLLLEHVGKQMAVTAKP